MPPFGILRQFGSHGCVQRQEPRFMELAFPYGDEAVFQIYILHLQMEHFRDAHSRAGHESDDREEEEKIDTPYKIARSGPLCSHRNSARNDDTT